MTRPNLASRLTYANVMSTVAVFIALGGTSYAAIKLPKNSVGSRELKKNAVTESRLNGDAVTGDKVKDGSLTLADLAAPLGARGPRGPEGPAGPAGARGPAGAGSGPVEAWKPLGFANGWANASAYSLGYTDGAYRKDANGIVTLQGVLTYLPGSPPANQVIATLPVGYRPARVVLFPTVTSGDTNSPGRIDIDENGNIIWRYGASGSNPGSIDITSLGGVSFDVG